MGQKVVECQYPTGICDWTVTGEHTNTGEGPECGACGATPDEYEEWRPNDGKCSHDSCIEVDGYRREFALRRPTMSREEREEIEADTELMRDEFHGRDLDGNISEEWAEYLDWQRSLGAVN